MPRIPELAEAYALLGSVNDRLTNTVNERNRALALVRRLEGEIDQIKEPAERAVDDAYEIQNKTLTGWRSRSECSDELYHFRFRLPTQGEINEQGFPQENIWLRRVHRDGRKIPTMSIRMEAFESTELEHIFAEASNDELMRQADQVLLGLGFHLTGWTIVGDPLVVQKPQND